MSTAVLERTEELHAAPSRGASRHLGPVRCERRLREIRPLIVDGGCDVRIDGAEVPEVLRVALLAWLPLRADDLARFESGLHGPTGAVVAASFVRPPVVWPLCEAARVATRCPGMADPERRVALHHYARGRIRPVHLERLRAAAGRVAAQLPLPAPPRGRDDEPLAVVASMLLVRYGLSAVAARAAGGLHLP